MKILLISYGIFEYDGRLKELSRVAEGLGEVSAIMVTTSLSDNEKCKYVHIKKEDYLRFLTYFSFVLMCIRQSMKIKENYILFSDNLFSAIPALIIRCIKKPQQIIQDVRELYYPEEIKSLFGRTCCRSEIILMKKADVVLCANDFRAEIMKTRYNLSNRPLVYENIRFLNEDFDRSALDYKYDGMFEARIKIVSTGGLSVQRGADNLVRAMIKLPIDYVLYILGGGSKSDEEKIESIIREEQITNVVLLPKIPLSELKYVLQRCDIGVVHYHRKDDNNKYCASGKIYEYLAEGLPIVTTENEPLVSFCNTNDVGIADDTYVRGITKIAENLSDYKFRARNYIISISAEKNNENCIVDIRSRLTNN